MSTKNITDIILSYYPGIQGIYFFGSYGTKEIHSESDIDIALLLPYQTSKNELLQTSTDCVQFLKEKFGRSIDLVNIRETSTVFQNEIINSSHERISFDADAIAEFEMKTLSEYQKLNDERKEILENFFATKRAYNI
jgi:uncharacterized protein